MPRIEANILFYPLTINKLLSNEILEDKYSSKNVVITAEHANDIYHYINYIEDSLFINAGNYLDTIADPTVLIRQKPAGVAYSDGDYAFKNANDNLICKVNKLFSLTASPRTCSTQSYSHTVLVTPPMNSAANAYIDLPTKVINHQSSHEVTIKFFVKFIGLTDILSAQKTLFNSQSNQYYFYKYGTALSIVINKISNTSFELKLINSSNEVVATYDDFYSRIGKWTFIALSYSSYHTDSAINAYYPPKINWQVGNTVTKITAATYSNIAITDLLTLTIPKEITALWTRLMISYDYFNGFMGIYSNSGDTTRILYSNLKRSSTADLKDIYTGSDWTNCLTDTYFDNLSSTTYNCVDDHDFVIQEENNNYSCAFKGLDDTACFSAAKTNCPLGFFDNSDDYCSCSNVDKKLMLISKNDNKNVCRRKII